MNTGMLHAYNKEEEKKKVIFLAFFCICCITTQARNNGLLKRRTDQISKGPKPGLSDKEPGNIFFHSSNVITSYKHCGKKKKLGKAHAYSLSPS